MIRKLCYDNCYYVYLNTLSSNSDSAHCATSDVLHYSTMESNKGEYEILKISISISNSTLMLSI